MSRGLLRVCTWNVNGLRTLPSPLKPLLDSLNADVICFQETKCSRDLDSELACVDGYNAYFSLCLNRPGYSAAEGFTQTLSSLDPTLDDPIEFICSQVEISRSDLKQLESEGRLVSVVLPAHCLKIPADFAETPPSRSVLILSVYVPRIVESEAKRVEFRILFERTLTWLVGFLSKMSHVVIAGDLNVCHKAHDHCELEQLDTLSSMVLSSRQWINDLLVLEQRDSTIVANGATSPGCFVDIFRHVHPTRPDAYTCWSSRTGARATNYGVRLDYILVDRALLAYFDAIPSVVIQSDLLTNQVGSDHCPVWAELPLSSAAVWDHPWPALCSRHWPQCQRKQTKLVTFVTRGTQEEPTTSTDHSVIQLKDHRLVTNSQPVQIDQCNGNINRPKRSAANAPKSCSKSKLKQAKLLIVPSSKSDAIASQLASQPESPPLANSEPNGSTAPPFSGDPDAPSVHAWRRILTGPKKPPLCRGHAEPCVMRTVKQELTASGARRGRRFWVCARPQGARDNPEARCETFIWDDRYQDRPIQ
ncbi:unnamed protein product [Echinostoma caproni]|uniref:DNA-(apurinic or apyrimidinic site) endonuclease n=1 Tax=Echinostoma caproni TaxID=27848 RepID=A0A183AA97_9TREM|nr:unnamed protein product [Echinostoma caproni]